DPIPGVDVSLEQIPGGIIFQGGGKLDTGRNHVHIGDLTLTDGTVTGTQEGKLFATSITASTGSIATPVSCTGTLTKTGGGTVTLSNSTSYNFANIAVN